MTNSNCSIGTSPRQKDGKPRVTGRAQYYADFILPGMLYTKIFRSPHPRADIVQIDVTEAEALSGVKLVMTHENYPQVFRSDLHYVGEHVAAVVAIDEDIAEAAIELIKIDYHSKPFVLDFERAMEPGAPQVFDGHDNCYDWEEHYYLEDRDPETRLFRKKKLHKFHGFGDVEKGFAEADLIVEESGLKYAYCKSPAMEPRGCTMDYSNEKLTVYTHSQGMHNEKLVLAKILGIDSGRVNYVSPFTGSSFGAKNPNVLNPNIASHHLLIGSLATMTLGQPVRMAYSREEEMLCGWSRGSIANVKLGFKKDGTLTTVSYDHWQEVGSGGDKFPPKNALLATGAVLYSRNCEHLRGKIRYVHTNRYLSSGWQGYGAPEGTYGMEVTMDKAAEMLGLDPIEIRKKNHMRGGDVDAGYDPLNYKSCYISSSGIGECLDAGAQEVDWENKWQPPFGKKGRIRHGLGVAIFCMGAGRPGDGNSSEAIVKIFPDGSAKLVCAIADVGQGQHTVQCQIVAEVLGIPYSRIGLVCHDTDSTPFATLVANSCGTWIQGWATYEAARDAKKQVLKLAADKLGVTANELDMKDNCIIKKSDSATFISFSDTFGITGKYGGIHEIIGHYRNNSPHEKCLKDGRKDQLYIPKEKGAQFVSLDIDTETGEFLNVRVVMAQNVGKALNPKIVEGQFFNARHGVGNSILGNDCLSDRKTGKLLNANWIDYKPTSILDCEVEPIIIEKPGDPTHPFGATACGEGAACPTVAAFSNAIYNALGVRIKESPFTPDKILAALNKK